MSAIAVLGCLFGDEAKAKVVDVLASDADIIVRFQGGSNAGHTIQFDNKRFVMHLIPSGIFHEDKKCALGSAVVIDPEQLEKEISALKEQGIIFKDRFFIDYRASIVLPMHKILDEKQEELSGDKKIGTTKRGIGPCYSDSISRIGLRMSDLNNIDNIIYKLSYLCKYHHIKMDEEEIKENAESLFSFGKRMDEYLINLPYFLDSCRKQDKEILFEGAQGTLLDIYFGTYPYVTSSHTISGGISIATGYPPKHIDLLIGVFKSYFTRVGSGPFPTELHDNLGEQIRRQGNEFGSTTGRPRRCGWFDAVAAKYSVMINGIDNVALTLLDVLSGIEEIKICIAYSIDGEIVEEFPSDQRVLEEVEPVYISMDTWSDDITQCKTWESLPLNAQLYVRKIEELLEIPVSIISVGPNRDQTIFLMKQE
ncbi:MAG: adenylosuccinate synthase [Candidatus Cloacimonadales bacterium]|jgi:adenylosuccinate synthase|nr:adenylosuccinate synthase [Candidatus Cloacimonadota bacterium]MDD2650274.1 adenylosuccinate synthase [Candidatus Cloacimonadota bacterium]MDD3501247.1 adenylosuccinate synthase [Candidatus Cloacimonadota bacterium]MDX9977541.1 adenylosuccinate synthase [Candidatus Cloacimonadales bacterium]